jgi:hypothetical protein
MIAGDVRSIKLSPFRSSSSAATYNQDPEAGAVKLISAIRDRCKSLGLADSMVAGAIMDIVIGDAASTAGSQRRLGRLDDARATATRLMVLAGRLVREYPDNAFSYRVLSEAHNQIKKSCGDLLQIVATGEDPCTVRAPGDVLAGVPGQFAGWELLPILEELLHIHGCNPPSDPDSTGRRWARSLACLQGYTVRWLAEAREKDQSTLGQNNKVMSKPRVSCDFRVSLEYAGWN